MAKPTQNKKVTGPVRLQKQQAIGKKITGKKPGDLKSKPKGKDA